MDLRATIRIVVARFCLNVVTFLALAGYLVAAAPHGKIHWVGDQCSVNSIQEAVDAAQAGDTVRIDAGNYHENLVVGKCVRLIGAGQSKTVIHGFHGSDGRRDNVIEVRRGTDLYIRGLTLRDGYEGMLVGPGSSVHIEQCSITHNEHYGIGFFRYDFNSFLYMRNCDVVANGDGVNLNSTQAVIVSSPVS